MRIKRLGHVFLIVSDQARAKGFYTNVLGFEVIEEDPEHCGVFMVLNDGGHVVDLVGIGGDAPPPRSIEDIEPRLGVGHIAFEVQIRGRSIWSPRS
jgi:catechol 2,3-dioxygenase-like lactoylglutathione lyase family enzyme